MSKNVFKKVSIGIGTILMPVMVLAADTINPQVAIRPEALLQNITNWLAGIALAIAVIMLLYAAIMYITGGASSDAMTKAKDALIYAVVGVVVALLAFSVVPLLKNVFFGTGY